MPESRTFKIQDHLMRGDDIRAFQEDLIVTALRWNVHLPLRTDGIYGLQTRSFAKMILFGSGFTHEQIDDGITPWLRTLLRNPEERSDEMNERRNGRWRTGFRDNLRKKFEADDPDVAAPIGKITTMSWGWHPGVHDGIDLICGPRAPIYAICDGEVIDVRSGGWWGKAPSGNVALGDGIIQIRCLVDDGPFKRGIHIGYGHAEGADVRVGQRVKAGQRLGEAGLANAWHIHLMANHGGTVKGIGEFDPEPLVRYAIRNS